MNKPMPATSSLQFAGHSLTEMLLAIRQAATNEARGLAALEELAARGEQQVFTAGVGDVYRLGAALGAAHALILALLPHETAVATLLTEHRQASAGARVG